MKDKILSTNQDVSNLDAFIEHVLNDVKNDQLSVSHAKAGLAELIHLIDNRSDGARVWLEQGRKIIHTLG